MDASRKKFEEWVKSAGYEPRPKKFPDTYAHRLDISRMEMMWETWQARNAEIEALRSALRFYADIKNWEWNTKPTDTDFILDCGSDIQRDFGDKARSALNALGCLCEVGGE